MTACHRAAAGKAPGPDAIPNEILKYLPESAHGLIYHLFRLMAKHNYTPKMVQQRYKAHLQT